MKWFLLAFSFLFLFGFVLFSGPIGSLRIFTVVRFSVFPVKSDRRTLPKSQTVFAYEHAHQVLSLREKPACTDLMWQGLLSTHTSDYNKKVNNRSREENHCFILPQLA